MLLDIWKGFLSSTQESSDLEEIEAAVAPPEPVYEKAKIHKKADRGPNLNTRQSRGSKSDIGQDAEFDWSFQAPSPPPPPPPPPPRRPPRRPPSPPPSTGNYTLQDPMKPTFYIFMRHMGVRRKFCKLFILGDTNWFLLRHIYSELRLKVQSVWEPYPS